MRWEYMTVDCSATDTPVRIWDTYGEDGWELVAVIPSSSVAVMEPRQLPGRQFSNVAGSTTHITAYFKRKKRPP